MQGSPPSSMSCSCSGVSPVPSWVRQSGGEIQLFWWPYWSHWSWVRCGWPWSFAQILPRCCCGVVIFFCCVLLFLFRFVWLWFGEVFGDGECDGCECGGDGECGECVEECECGDHFLFSSWCCV